MSLIPGWYQTSKPLQFKAIEEFATNSHRVFEKDHRLTRSLFSNEK